MKNPTPYILWGTLGSSQLLMLVVGKLAAPVGGDEATARLLVPAAVGLATVSVVLGFGGLAPAFRGPPRWLVRWSLAESATLVGLVAWMVSGQALYAYACAAFGVTAWAAAFPSDPASWPTDAERRGRG